MATLTTKKQARYVRGPDGIYRKEEPKVLDLVAPPPSSSTEESVEKIIDELIECGYHVEDPLRTLPNAATSQHKADSTTRETENTAHLSAENKKLNLGYNPFGLNKSQEPSNSITVNTGSVTSPNIAVDTSANTHSRASSYSSPLTETMTPMDELIQRQKIVDLVVPEPGTVATLMVWYRLWLARFPVEKFMEWSLPFFLGMATMYTLLAAQPMLLYYGGVVAYGLKLFFIYGTFFVGLCWKAGWIKVDLWKLWGETLGIFLKSANNVELGAAPDQKVAVSPLATSPQLSHAHMAANHPGVESTPTEVVSERLRDVRPFIPPLREEPELVRPRVARVSTDLNKPRHRTKMSPVRLSRDDRRHSSASLDRPKDPYRDVRDQYTKVREFRDMNGAVRDFKEPKERFYKPLPPVASMPHDLDADLPMVNEVKLKSLEQESLLERLNTKKLVLGTRANYLRFLQNVDN